MEHLGGKWPFFISPRQIMVCPISQKHEAYCESVYLYLHRLGYAVEKDDSKKKLGNRIRAHQLEQWNFILVAGDEEMKSGQVDIRSRDNQRLGKMRVDSLEQFFNEQLPAKSSKYNSFYSSAWNPADYPLQE
uniref:Anticodon-binding domain-containing protein n=1 Tax=Strombidium inclinatum TaxID=197538 RepID=A0A7S3MVV3_9SPIT|mmetsp:Transcript_18995/g.29131  ORF Transcript_18995/g.29131 Transcript_18995/m.29131 type:complete len:132 (+) Transcript_18995:460-855(+)